MTLVDDVQRGAGNTLTYDPICWEGLLGIKHVLGGSNFNAYYGFVLSAAAIEVYTRGYFRIENGASGSHGLIWGEESSAMKWSLTFDQSTKKFYLQDSTLNAFSTSTITYTLGSWFRLETYSVADTTVGSLAVDIYLDPESEQASETISMSGKNTGTLTDQVNVGTGGNAASTFYSDSFQARPDKKPKRKVKAPAPPYLVVAARVF